ncbi:MAG: 50S ribosomal protein L25 [bacterium]|nr:50S ribosomal protein L25 [bacterium]
MEQLLAEKREVFGKQLSGLRASGRVPAIVYGAGSKESLSLSVVSGDFVRLWKKAGESTILSLSIDGDGKKNVLIHDVAMDPVTQKPLHVDFYEVSKDHKLKVNVPFVFDGESRAVKELGGMLEKVLHDAEVEAFPDKLPHELIIDISKIATFDDHITLGDIKMPEGATLTGEPESLVAKVNPPRTQEELDAELAETTDASLDDIEVEEKGKQDDDESEGSDESSEGSKEKSE